MGCVIGPRVDVWSRAGSTVMTPSMGPTLGQETMARPEDITAGLDLGGSRSRPRGLGRFASFRPIVSASLMALVAGRPPNPVSRIMPPPRGKCISCVVPEPSTRTVMILGFFFVGFVVHRRIQIRDEICDQGHLAAHTASATLLGRRRWRPRRAVSRPARHYLFGVRFQPLPICRDFCEHRL